METSKTNDLTPKVTFTTHAETEEIELFNQFYEAGGELEFDHLLAVMRIAEEHPGASIDATKISLHPTTFGPVFGLWRRIVDPSGDVLKAFRKFDGGTVKEYSANPSYEEHFARARTEVEEVMDERSGKRTTYKPTRPGNDSRLSPSDLRKIEWEKREVRRIQHATFASRLAGKTALIRTIQKPETEEDPNGQLKDVI